MDPDVDALMNTIRRSGLTPPDALAVLGDLINGSGDANRLDGVETALLCAEGIRKAVATEHERALAHYFTANAHAIRRRLVPVGKPINEWDDPDLAGEIRHLRMALQCQGWADLDPYQACQMLTNLGNALSRCGRLVEALEWYDKALSLDSNFGMAVANRGLVLVDYANRVHDRIRRNVTVCIARTELLRATELPLEKGAEAIVSRSLARLEARAPAGFPWHESFPTGTFDRFPVEDQPYRRWALKHRLFLEEINDLGEWPIGARDTLTLPGHVSALGEGPRYIGLFNQMKQEFVAARWMLFDGLGERPHPADTEVVLADTMDYPALSFRTEQLRCAFRSAYSLLDKIAFFLNHYLQLGIRDENVAFRTVWFESHKTQRLRSPVAKALSEPIRALVWVGQDMFDPDSEYRAALLPDAKDLWEIRRRLEHRYLKLHGEGWSEAWDAVPSRVGLRDDLALSLSREAFIEKTYRLMKMVRASLVYLAWAMNAEEDARREARDPGEVTPPIVLPPLLRPGPTS
jgi:tetratricopeptide (TPR) repeat protein